MHHHKYYCTECQIVMSEGGICPGKHEMILAPRRWQGPKRSNRKAWKIIKSGNIWWDLKKISKVSESNFLIAEKVKILIKLNRKKRNGQQRKSSKN